MLIAALKLVALAGLQLIAAQSVLVPLPQSGAPPPTDVTVSVGGVDANGRTTVVLEGNPTDFAVLGVTQLTEIVDATEVIWPAVTVSGFPASASCNIPVGSSQGTCLFQANVAGIPINTVVTNGFTNVPVAQTGISGSLSASAPTLSSAALPSEPTSAVTATESGVASGISSSAVVSSTVTGTILSSTGSAALPSVSCAVPTSDTSDLALPSYTTNAVDSSVGWEPSSGLASSSASASISTTGIAPLSSLVTSSSRTSGIISVTSSSVLGTAAAASQSDAAAAAIQSSIGAACVAGPSTVLMDVLMCIALLI